MSLRTVQLLILSLNNLLQSQRNAAVKRRPCYFLLLQGTVCFLHVNNSLSLETHKINNCVPVANDFLLTSKYSFSAAIRASHTCGSVMDINCLDILKVYMRLVNESLLANNLSLMRYQIEAEIALRYFVSLLWILVPIFWSKISESLFVILTKFLNPQPSCTFSSRRRCLPCWSPSLNKRRARKCFAYFESFFLLVKSTYPHPHIAAAASLNDMAWLTGQPSRCGHKALSAICTRTVRIHCLPKLYADSPHTLSAETVRGISADTVRRCKRDLSCS